MPAGHAPAHDRALSVGKKARRRSCILVAMESSPQPIWPFLVAFTTSLLWAPSSPAFDGADFPVGWPDGAGWSHGTCTAQDCSDESCLDGLDFLEPHRYPKSGCIRHPGEDWNTGQGDDDCGEFVHAVADGVVVETPDGCEWGELMVRHDGVPGYGTVWSVYGHMRTSAFRVGRTIGRGCVLGEVSKKGTGFCHLHLEIRHEDLGMACAFPNQSAGGDDPAQILSSYLEPTSFIETNRPTLPDPQPIENVTLLVDWEGAPPSTVDLTILPTGDMQPAAQVTLAPEPSGLLSLPVGIVSSAPYDLFVSAPGFLSVRFCAFLQSNHTYQVPTLLAGDLNGDDTVNALDWSLMSPLWLTDDHTADINDDGKVNSIDFSYLSKNWQEIGDDLRELLRAP